MMAGNQPLFPIPLVRKGVAGSHAGTSLLEGEGIESGVDRRIAINLDFTRVDASHRMVLQEVVEIVFLINGRESRSA